MCRPSYLCVCRVGTPRSGALINIYINARARAGSRSGFSGRWGPGCGCQHGTRHRLRHVQWAASHEAPTHAVAEEGPPLAPTPTAHTPQRELHLLCISVADLPRRSSAEAMCTATERRCACPASHGDVDELTSFSYCRWVRFRLVGAAPCPSSVGRAAPPARSSRRRSRRVASATRQRTPERTRF